MKQKQIEALKRALDRLENERSEKVYLQNTEMNKYRDDKKSLLSLIERLTKEIESEKTVTLFG